MKINCLEINQERVRQDVIGTVWIIVKRTWVFVWNIEVGVIDQKIARNFPESAPSELFQYLAEFFRDQNAGRRTP